MKIIVDTNIIFSALLNSKSTFGNILLNSGNAFQFYSCTYMRYEIQKHWNKLKKISKLTDKQLEESQFSLFNKLTFINEELIPKKIWIESETLLNNVDMDDIDFVALTKYLKGKLWTGDKVLYNGLKEKGFKNVISSNEVMVILKKHRSRKQKKRKIK